jgi:RNA-directed DNA polymerase
MRSGDAGNRAGMPDYSSGGRGRNPQGPVAGASSLTAKRDNSCQKTQKLMEAVVERENMFRALRQVEANKGSAGVDGVPVHALRDCLRKCWPRIKEELLEGRYQPQPVRKVEIPKPGGKGMRQLGIPTVMDRLIQQALNQVMQPIFDPDFPSQVTDSAPAEVRIKPCGKRESMWHRAGDGSLTWTWRSSLTALTMTSLWRGLPAR